MTLCRCAGASSQYFGELFGNCLMAERIISQGHLVVSVVFGVGWVFWCSGLRCGLVVMCFPFGDFNLN